MASPPKSSRSTPLPRARVISHIVRVSRGQHDATTASAHRRLAGARGLALRVGRQGEPAAARRSKRHALAPQRRRQPERDLRGPAEDSRGGRLPAAHHPALRLAGRRHRLCARRCRDAQSHVAALALLHAPRGQLCLAQPGRRQRTDAAAPQVGARRLARGARRERHDVLRAARLADLLLPRGAVARCHSQAAAQRVRARERGARGGHDLSVHLGAADAPALPAVAARASRQLARRVRGLPVRAAAVLDGVHPFLRDSDASRQRPLPQAGPRAAAAVGGAELRRDRPDAARVAHRPADGAARAAPAVWVAVALRGARAHGQGAVRRAALRVCGGAAGLRAVRAARLRLR
eukprot:2358637-Prymnesium_polylepis.1